MAAPKTTDDYSAVFKYMHGDELYGDAKDCAGMQSHIKDIDEAYGQQSKYKKYYVNTLSKKWAEEVVKSKPF